MVESSLLDPKLTILLAIASWVVLEGIKTLYGLLKRRIDLTREYRMELVRKRLEAYEVIYKRLLGYKNHIFDPITRIDDTSESETADNIHKSSNASEKRNNIPKIEDFSEYIKNLQPHWDYFLQTYLEISNYELFCSNKVHKLIGKVLLDVLNRKIIGEFEKTPMKELKDKTKEMRKSIDNVITQMRKEIYSGKIESGWILESSWKTKKVTENTSGS